MKRVVTNDKLKGSQPKLLLDIASSELEATLEGSRGDVNIHDLKTAYEKAIGHSTSDGTVYKPRSAASPDMQGASGLGLEAQSEAISRFAEAERLKIADTFAEVETLEPPTPGFGDL